MKAPRKPLAPGTRVRVYDGASSYKGTVLRDPVKSFPDAVYVELDEDECIGNQKWLGHRFQVRRLIPKPNPASRERLVRWISGIANFKAEVWSHPTPANLADPRRFEEVREGEKVISKADLAKAWDIVSAKNHGVSTCFGHLAEALGFGGEK